MDPSIISALVNLGAAGAVIVVVAYFLNYLTKENDKWQTFIIKRDEESKSDNKDLRESVSNLVEVTRSLAQEVSEMSARLNDHDLKVALTFSEAIDRIGSAITSGKPPKKARSPVPVPLSKE